MGKVRERISTVQGQFHDTRDGTQNVLIQTDYARSDTELSLMNGFRHASKRDKAELNIGGPWAMQYIRIRRYPDYVKTLPWGPNANQYTGPIVASGPSYADVASWSRGNPIQALDLKAPSLYQEMKPTKPIVNTANALYELRDFSAMLEKLHEPLKDIKSIPIGMEFGWIPLFTDIRRTVEAQWKWQKKLAWLIKNEGKPVRTRSKVRTEIDSEPAGYTDTDYYSIYPAQDFYTYGGIPTIKRTAVWKTDFWASARWKWFLPGGPRDMVWDMRMWGKLMGMDVSPAMVWNALPYTWLMDWFGQAGDSIANLDSGIADRLYADRFYCMAHRYRHDIWDVNAKIRTGEGQYTSINPITESYNGWKTRIRGNPFGNLLSESQLNDGQWKILGELGLSRL